MKFGCGFADCGLKKNKLAVPSTEKKTVAMAVKTGKLTANGVRKKKFLRRDFEDLEVQMGMGDVTSPVAVIGNNGLWQ